MTIPIITGTSPEIIKRYPIIKLFGIRKSHHLWILGQNEKSTSLSLEKVGLQISYFELYNPDVLNELFQLILFLQGLILLLVERHDSTELRYLIEKRILKTSSDIIYNV